MLTWPVQVTFDNDALGVSNRTSCGTPTKYSNSVVIPSRQPSNYLEVVKRTNVARL